LLRQLCVHSIACDEVAGRLRTIRGRTNDMDLCRLMALHEKGTKTLLLYMRELKLTPRTRVGRNADGGASEPVPEKKPWDV
jgi:hypothetical protein